MANVETKDYLEDCPICDIQICVSSHSEFVMCLSCGWTRFEKDISQLPVTIHEYMDAAQLSMNLIKMNRDELEELFWFCMKIYWEQP